MARNQEFKSSALFHGTTHPFEIGDVVLPASTTGVSSHWLKILKENPEEMGTKVAQDVAERAHATRNYDAANWYAHVAAAETGKDTDANVYEVVPLDPKEAQEGPHLREEVTSKKGFKVVKKVK